jgi:hypothetical protein
VNAGRILRELWPLAAVWGSGTALFLLLGGSGERRRPNPARKKRKPRPARKAKAERVTALARALQEIERDTAECERSAVCYEPGRDRRGRRRRCRTTFRSKGEAVAAVDRAMDGELLRYLERADPGSQDLRDLEEATEDRRGRRRRLPTWWDAVAWSAPSSRRWPDYDPARLELVSAALERNLTHGGGPAPLPLSPPLEVQRLEEAEERRRMCAIDGADRAQQIAAERKARRRAKLPPLSEVPF